MPHTKLTRLHWLSVLLLPAICGALFGVAAKAADPFEPQHIEFFEKKIRPVLVKQCYECHSQAAAKVNKLRGGLYLDSRDGILQGGDSGPAATPGSLDDSPLLEALNYESYEMPPKGKLPQAVIDDFQKWIELGLPDPRTGGPAIAAQKIDIEAGRQHWAYQPIRVTAPEGSQGETPIDRYIFAQLAAANLEQASPADRTTLVRRLYFDLTGLPPTPAETQAFLNDTHPAAYERLVDRLLASPHFGERWARHWLDVVRYADSITLRGFVFPQAWRYRDYVVQTFNEDHPFDQFIREQLAGDLLPASDWKTQRRQLIATTFLTMGNNNYEDQNKEKLNMDVVDEQLEVIGRGFLAQTIGCARCHDHKFDPIPTRDYYALAGILRNVKTLEHSNVSKWIESALPTTPEMTEKVKQHEQLVASTQSQIKQLKDVLAKQGKSSDTKTQVVAAESLPGIFVDDSEAETTGQWVSSQFVKRYLGQGYRHDDSKDRAKKTAKFLPTIKKAGKYEVRFAYTASSNRSRAVPVTILSANGRHELRVDQQVPPPIKGHFVSLGTYDFGAGESQGVIVSNAVKSGVVIIDGVHFLPESVEPESVAPEPKPAPDAAAVAAAKEMAARAKQTKEQIKQLEGKLKELAKSKPQVPKCMSVKEEAKTSDLKLHIRGDVSNLGEVVPRGFLQVATYTAQGTLPEQQSGRVQLGEWITAHDNPLAKRVIANRVWHWLFGSGIVRTVDNFGTTGEAPSHPQLLDYLASRLEQNDWRLKPLIREIVLSNTYRSTSSPNPELRRSALKVDPENRLLWRMNRRRLDAECLMDSMLAVSQELAFELGGSTIRNGLSADYGYKHNSRRRALYWPVFRNSLPPAFDVFDFANPSLVTGKRNNSSTASQALFLLNNPFVRERAVVTARRLLEVRDTDDERIAWMFETVLNRPPTSRESASMKSFVSSREDTQKSTEETWTLAVQALFASLDFRFAK